MRSAPPVLAHQLVDALRELARRMRGPAKLDVLALQSSNSFPTRLQGSTSVPFHHATSCAMPRGALIHLMNVRTRSFPYRGQQTASRFRMSHTARCGRASVRVRKDTSAAICAGADRSSERLRVQLAAALPPEGGSYDVRRQSWT